NQDDLVVAGGGEGAAVWSEGQAPDTPAVAAQGQELLARLLAQRSSVPNPHRSVEAARHEPVPLRAEGHHRDPQIVMPPQAQSFPTGVHIPDLCGLIEATRGQPPGIAAPGHAENRPDVSAEGEEFPAGLNLPDLYLAVLPSGYVPSGGGNAHAIG